MNSAEATTRDAPVLVFGASGYIGSNLVPYLLERGASVRAVSREPAVLEARGWREAEIVAADALAPATLPAALDGIEIAYYLVHSMAAGPEFARLDIAAAENFAAAAAAAGVRRIVYLGALVPDDADSAHICSRRDTGDALRRGRVPVIEIRAGIVVGAGSAAFEVMRDLVFHLPIMLTPRWVRARSSPIALANLLEYLHRLPAIEQAAGRVFDAAGPDTLNYERMMRTLAEVAGKRQPLILPVAVLTPRLSSYWLRLVTSVPAPVAQALIGGLKHDFTADSAAIESLVPQRLLNFRESVEAAFAAERRTRVEARWVEGAFTMRQQRPDYAFYAKRASGAAVARASAAAVWRVVAAIGGANRYYYLNTLWTLREVLDWIAGGHALKRGRRHPQELRVGDRIDSWKVIGLEPERRLTLSFGMRAPGAGVLEFELEQPEPGRTRLTATAYWHPAGVSGLLYWYALAPAHRVIFDGMTREICNRAEALERDASAVAES